MTIAIGDRVRSKETGRYGVAENVIAGGFVAVRWDDGRGAVLNRTTDLVRVPDVREAI